MRQIVIVCGNLSYECLKMDCNELKINLKHLVKKFSIDGKGFFYFNIDDLPVIEAEILPYLKFLAYMNGENEPMLNIVKH